MGQCSMRTSARQAYAIQYPNPIKIPAGATVTVERRDGRFTRWLWCRATDGRAGWVPETLLSATEPGPATVVEAYEATELPLAAGDEVELLQSFDGFAWGRRADGRAGWFPLSIVAGHESSASAT